MSLSRRDLLKSTILAGAVGAVGQFWLPMRSAVAAGLGDELSTPFKAFVQGLITKIDGRTIRVDDQNGARTNVVVSDMTSEIWRGGDVQLSELEVGDFVYVRGVELSAGQVAAANVWANIVNLSANVAQVGTGSCILEGNPGTRVAYTNTTRLYLPATSTPLSSMAILSAGMSVQVLGMWERAAGQVLATKVWLS